MKSCYVYPYVFFLPIPAHFVTRMSKCGKIRLIRETSVRECVCICVGACVFACVRVCVFVRCCGPACVCLCVSVCVYLCVRVWKSGIRGMSSMCTIN